MGHQTYEIELIEAFLISDKVSYTFRQFFGNPFSGNDHYHS